MRNYGKDLDFIAQEAKLRAPETPIDVDQMLPELDPNYKKLLDNGSSISEEISDTHLKYLLAKEDCSHEMKITIEGNIAVVMKSKIMSLREEIQDIEEFIASISEGLDENILDKEKQKLNILSEKHTEGGELHVINKKD